MTTAKKPVAKKVELTPTKKKAIAEAKSRLEFARAQSSEQFAMPMEVKEWIDQAASRLKSMQSKIDRLETEIKELKSYKRWAEHKILGSSPE
jgi:uncharacterized coiled-coil DUF342 family protein